MFILLLTGPSATGKSTIARKLVEIDPRWQLINERVLLHELAIAAGETRVRNWWYKIGTEKLVQNARTKTLALLEWMREGGEAVIIDGCYDPLLAEEIKRRFHDSAYLTVAVTASCCKRASYMKQRLGSSLEEATEEMRLIDRFKEEAGMLEVIKRADAAIANNGPIQESVRMLLGILTQEGYEVG